MLAWESRNSSQSTRWTQYSITCQHFIEEAARWQLAEWDFYSLLSWDFFQQRIPKGATRDENRWADFTAEANQSYSSWSPSITASLLGSKRLSCCCCMQFQEIRQKMALGAHIRTDLIKNLVHPSIVLCDKRPLHCGSVNDIYCTQRTDGQI